MRCAALLMATAAAIASPAARALTYLVGSDGFCTHATIQGAIDAAHAHAGPDLIRISRNAIWSQQALVIDTDQEVTLVGGYVSCVTDFGDGVYTDIDGAGGSEESVLRINGGPNSIVTLSTLRIKNGDPSILGGVGGGIHYEGSGVLGINNSAIISNFAVKGGGIYANSSSGSARLVIGQNVAITGNTARGDGGGVFVNGMLVEMAESGSLIAFNKALAAPGFTGYGGGLVVRSTGDRPGVGLISSTGVGTLGAIYGNEAKRGGGVAVSAGAGTSASARLSLFSRSADTPAAIRGNFASEIGGGIYVWPDTSGENFGQAIAQLWRAELTGNAAPEGAAAYIDNSDSTLDTTIGGLFLVNEGLIFFPGALPCPDGAYCGRISDNETVTGEGVPTDGAVILLDDDSEFHAFRALLIEGNRAGRLVDAQDDVDTEIALYNAAVVENEVSQELFRASGSSEITLVDSTVAANLIGAPQVLAASRDQVTLQRSLLWQPGKSMLNTGSGTPLVQHVIASEVASIGGGPAAVTAEPRFIDPARGDYRLRAASAAIDYAPAVMGDDRDAFNRPRDVRIDVVPRPGGTVRDVGAFERQGLLPLLLNGEFEGDANLWFLPVGHLSAYSTDNAPSSAAGSGSIRVSGTTGAGRLLGIAQCIEIPGPGTYALNGWGHSSGTPEVRNPVALIWELRPNGGAGCIDGPITTGGELSLGSSDQWSTAASPALIDIPVALWNFRTSVTVLLAVYPNATNTDFNGWFDRISLTLAGAPPGPLLSDGFE